MTDADNDDSLTKLNTQLNRSMVLIETTTENTVQNMSHNKNKSIKINTEAQPPSTPGNHHNVNRKSILKKADTIDNEQSLSDKLEAIESDAVDNQLINESSIKTDILHRPHNLQELIVEENLIIGSTNSSFDSNDWSDSEEIWMMDIPKTIDPEDLKGQTLMIGGKTKLKIGKERYCAANHEVQCSMTCIFSSGKEKRKFKAVNIKPAGLITVRRKLPGTRKIEPMLMERTEVPFPENLRVRHPLLGINYEENINKG